jgi:SOS-response transcriptional repressor LexA
MKPAEQSRRENLCALVGEHGGTSNLAKVVDRPESQISQLVHATVHSQSGKPRTMGSKLARHIEKCAGKPDGWMDTDHSNRVSEPLAHSAYRDSNVELGPTIKEFVPLISWEWLPCPVKHSPKTFMLRVRGESMYNPNGRPSFAHGDFIFVDPDRRAEHGSMVVAYHGHAKEAMFKQLVIKGEQKYLQAINPGWTEPMISVTDTVTICGVVIFKGEKL